MRTIKRQLRRFYESHGIGARRAEKLIKSDLNAVRRHCYVDGPHPGNELSQVMLWDRTPQGWYYWAARQGWCEARKLRGHPSPLHA